MISHLFRREPRARDTISTLYGMIVAQARRPCFYEDYAVADTVNGRFDLIVLHLTLVLERLSAEPALRELGQRLFDHFCRDMDANLREMGIGDLSVPKEMRRIGDAFYGRSQAYLAALKASETQELAQKLAQKLAEVIARNVYGLPSGEEAAPRRLAAYMRQAHHDLTAQDGVSIGRGEVRFPDPATIPGGPIT
jgi:cytochrome b pre-mRNA-processing protein 3